MSVEGRNEASLLQCLMVGGLNGRDVKLVIFSATDCDRQPEL